MDRSKKHETKYADLAKELQEEKKGKLEKFEKRKLKVSLNFSKRKQETENIGMRTFYRDLKDMQRRYIKRNNLDTSLTLSKPYRQETSREVKDADSYFSALATDKTPRENEDEIS